MKMNFYEAWQFLKAMEPKVLFTDTGKRFTFKFREDSIEDSIVFLPRDGQGKEKSQSKQRFSDFFHKYFDEGKRDREDFRNLTGEKSPSGAYSYFMPVFQRIEACEKEIVNDMVPTGVESPPRVEVKSYYYTGHSPGQLAQGSIPLAMPTLWHQNPIA